MLDRMLRKDKGLASAISAIVAVLALGACGDSSDTSSDAPGASGGDAAGGGDVPGAEVEGPLPDGETPSDAADTTSANPGDAGDTDESPSLPQGDPCTNDEECQSGWCVPSALGVICVEPCRDTCPEGWSCVQTESSTTDPVFLCVPLTVPPQPPPGDVVDDTTSSDAAPGDDTFVDDAWSDVGPGSDTIIGDQDGDGIPDDIDNLPCLAIYLTIYNENVSAASVMLNGSEVVGSSAFPTNDPIRVAINAVAGENTLALGGKLTGSPADTLTLVVMDTQNTLYFSTVIVRQPGPPRDQTFTFVVDASCD